MGRKNRRKPPTPLGTDDYRRCLHAANGDLIAVVWAAGEGETALSVFVTAGQVEPAERERAAAELCRLAPEWTHDEAYDLLWGE